MLDVRRTRALVRKQAIHVIIIFGIQTFPEAVAVRDCCSLSNLLIDVSLGSSTQRSQRPQTTALSSSMAAPAADEDEEEEEEEVG